jgi:hypothetical protein
MGKISAYTKVAVLAATDELVVNDGGATKKIIAQDLGAVFRGAMVNLSGAQTISSGATTTVKWDTNQYDTKWQPNDAGGVQRFWLGVNRTFVDGDVTVGADTIDDTGHGFITGEGPVRMTSSGTLPAGLAVDTDYWIIRVDDNTYKVATSRANALAGTDVDITAAAGSGTHTLNTQYYFIVPAGVSWVELTVGVFWGSGSAGNDRYWASGEVNETSVPGFGQNESGTNENGNVSHAFSSPALSVSEGDRIRVRVNHVDAATEEISSGFSTFFAIKVVR